jgi:hypothetical protein
MRSSPAPRLRGLLVTRMRSPEEEDLKPGYWGHDIVTGRNLRTRCGRDKSKGKEKVVFPQTRVQAHEERRTEHSNIRVLVSGETGRGFGSEIPLAPGTSQTLPSLQCSKIIGSAQGQ